MKKTTLFVMAVGLLTFQSCSDNSKTTGSQTPTATQTSLAGKVYGLSDPIDTTKCERIPPGTDYFQTLLFLDDSSFIQIVNSCCPDIGEDFPAAWYFTGKYEMDDKELTLTFNPNMAIYYVMLIENPESDTLLSITHVNLEKIDYTVDKLPRLNCKNAPYFKQMTGNWKGQLMVQSLDTLANQINEIKANGVWDKLFNRFYQFLPNGHQLKDVNGEFGPAIDKDFDKDGVTDLAILLFEEIHGLPIFCIYLSSNFNSSKSMKYCDWPFMMHQMKYENGLLTLFSDNGSMGIYGSIELKYDSVEKSMAIVKYEDSEGNKTIEFSDWKF